MTLNIDASLAPIMPPRDIASAVEDADLTAGVAERVVALGCADVGLVATLERLLGAARELSPYVVSLEDAHALRRRYARVVARLDAAVSAGRAQVAVLH